MPKKTQARKTQPRKTNQRVAPQSNGGTWHKVLSVAEKALTALPVVMAALPTSGTAAPVSNIGNVGLPGMSTMTVPAASGRAYSARPANIRHGADGSITISKVEKVCDIMAPTDNAGALEQSYKILWTTPVSLATPNFAPWGSRFAPMYETFQFKALAFIYETALPTTAGGKIYMAMDPDPDDRPPITSEQMMAYKGATSASLWMPQVMTVPANLTSVFSGDKVLRVRSKSDAVISEAGRFYLASEVGSGVNAGDKLGDLYVSYSVVLKRPNLAVGSPCCTIGSGTGSALIGNTTANALVLEDGGGAGNQLLLAPGGGIVSSRAAAQSQIDGNLAVGPLLSTNPNLVYDDGGVIGNPRDGIQGLVFKQTGYLKIDITAARVAAPAAWEPPTIVTTGVAPVGLIVPAEAADYVEILRLQSNGYATGLSGAGVLDAVTWSYAVKVRNTLAASQYDLNQACVQFQRPFAFTSGAAVNEWIQIVGVTIFVTQLDEEVGDSLFPQGGSVDFA